MANDYCKEAPTYAQSCRPGPARPEGPGPDVQKGPPHQGAGPGHRRLVAGGNYLSACQLYLLDNPLLREPLKEEHLKRTIVGYWGTCPGQNFIYTHLNRAIVKYDLDMIYLSGPGHGGNAIVAQDYLDGSYSEVYPNISRDAAGMKRLFRQFAFPGGIPSHTAPETPGSINEGGELGYSLAPRLRGGDGQPGPDCRLRGG